MSRKIFVCMLTLCAIMGFGVQANAESLFTKELFWNYPFHSIKANSDVCIAANEYYVAIYESGEWSKPTFDADRGYIITDICVKDNVFYMSEYNKETGKGRIMQSADGSCWECAAEYDNGSKERFKVDGSDDRILVDCSKETVLPDGFKKHTGKEDWEIPWKHYETEYKGEPESAKLI